MNRVAIVTGAGGDIGRAVAISLADAGHHILIADLDEEGMAQTGRAVERAGGQATIVRTNVIDRESVARAVTMAAGLGKIRILVNAAGNLRPTKVVDIPEEEWDLIVGVNLKGTFLFSQAVLASMSEQGWGRIVNLSSTAGKNVSTVGGAHYTAAKAGVLGFTRHLASEVAHLGITVNAVCPGLIETQMVHNTISQERMDQYAHSFPIRRLGQPEEVAALIRFLASDEAAYITGAAVDINGGDLMV